MKNTIDYQKMYKKYKRIAVVLGGVLIWQNREAIASGICRAWNWIVGKKETETIEEPICTEYTTKSEVL